MTSNRRLMFWYRKYNEKYFGNRLTYSVQVTYDNINGGSCQMGQCVIYTDGSAHIRIWPHNHSFKQDCIDLLHEMTHLSVYPNDKHGRLFQAEMDRIYGLGAYRGLL